MQGTRVLHTPKQGVDFFEPVFAPVVPTDCLMLPPFATVEAITGFRTPNKTGKE